MTNIELKQKVQDLRSPAECLCDLEKMVTEQLLPVFMALTVVYMGVDEEKKSRLRAKNPELFNQFVGMLEKGKSLIENKNQRCADCGIGLDREDKFCKECGKELT